MVGSIPSSVLIRTARFRDGLYRLVFAQSALKTPGGPRVVTFADSRSAQRQASWSTPRQHKPLKRGRWGRCASTIRKKSRSSSPGSSGMLLTASIIRRKASIHAASSELGRGIKLNRSSSRKLDLVWCHFTADRTRLKRQEAPGSGSLLVGSIQTKYISFRCSRPRRRSGTRLGRCLRRWGRG